MAFVPPYTVTVSSTAGGLARCVYTDATGAVVPEGQVLTTSTPEGEAGALQFNFVEAQSLQLVGAVAKTVGHDPTLHAHNCLDASRSQTTGGAMLDSVTVPWAPDAYTLRGVVLLFVQVDANGDMVNFFPSADPQVQNGEE